MTLECKSGKAVFRSWHSFVLCISLFRSQACNWNVAGIVYPIPILCLCVCDELREMSVNGLILWSFTENLVEVATGYCLFGQ